MLRRELPNIDTTPLVRVYENPIRPNYTNNSMSPDAILKSGPLRPAVTQYNGTNESQNIRNIQNDPNYNLRMQDSQIKPTIRNEIVMDPKVQRGLTQTPRMVSESNIQKLPKRSDEFERGGNQSIYDSRNNQYVNLYGAKVAENYVRKNLNSRPEIVYNETLNTIQQRSDALLNLHMTNFDTRYDFNDAQKKSKVRIHETKTVFPRGENTRL